MKTIEERAKNYLAYERDFLGRNPSCDMVGRAYCAGAIEQRTIDTKEFLKETLKRLKDEEERVKKDMIGKACEWLKSHLYKDKPDLVYRTNMWKNNDHVIRDFEESMEE